MPKFSLRFRLFALLLLAAGWAGCSVSDDDRDFYYKGWVNPNQPKNWDEHGAPTHPPGGQPDPLID